MEIQVRPQQTRSPGTTTRHPASSSTSTAACGTDGWKWLPNVSGHSTTSPREPSPDGARVANHSWKLCSANTGATRCSSMPPALITSLPSTGACSTAFTTAGAREAMAAHSGSQPIE